MNVRLLSETGTHKPKVTGSNPVAATADITTSQMTKGLANQGPTCADTKLDQLIQSRYIHAKRSLSVLKRQRG